MSNKAVIEGVLMDFWLKNLDLDEAVAQLCELIVKERIKELQYFWDKGAEHGIDNRIAELNSLLEQE